MKRRWAILGCALLLSGCVVAPKGAKQEQQKVAEAGKPYATTRAARTVPDLPLHPAWRDVLQRAFLASGTLEASYHEWAMAASRIDQAGTWPTQSLELGYEYMFSGGRMTAFDRSTFNAGLMDPTPLPNKTYQDAKVAWLEAQAAGEKFRQAKFDLQGRVLTAWADYALQAERIRIQQHAVGLLERIAEATASRVAVGGAQQDLLHAQIELRMARNELESMRAELGRQHALLNALMVRPPQAPLDPPTTMPAGRTLPDDDEALLDLGVRNNPTLAALERDKLSREAAIQRAKLEYQPQFNFAAAITGSTAQALGGSILLPTRLPAIRAMVAEARSDLARVEALADQQRSDSASQFAAILVALRDAERRKKVFEHDVLPLAMQAVELTRLGYSSGSARYLDALEAERTLLDVKLAAAEAAASRERLLASLEVLAGADVDTLGDAAGIRWGTTRPSSQPNPAGRRSEVAVSAENHLPNSSSANRGHWKTVVVVGAVAVAAFSFGNFWTREFGSTREHRADGDSREKKSVAMAGDKPAAMSAATPAPTGGKPLWTCSMHPQVIQGHPGLCPICHMELTPVKSGATAGDGIVAIDPVIVQNMGVRTAPVMQGPLQHSIKAVGYLLEPEPLHRDINLRVSGWIDKLYANVNGMRVEKGAPLFDLYSPDLTVSIDELISARKQAAGGADKATSDALVEASKRKLRQYGLEEEQVESLARLDAAPRIVTFTAPTSGHIVDRSVYEGGAVKASDLVMRIASTHRMWIDAQVFEQQLGGISEGMAAAASVLSKPGSVISGKVLMIYPHLDPQTRTATVRIEVPNENHELREGMYANVELLSPAREATVVPREAVIDSGRRQIAFVALGGGRFEPHELRLGADGEHDTVEVLAGLKAGETVVTSGQFLLDSESRLNEAIAKHLSLSQATATTGKASMSSDVSRSIPHTTEIATAYLDLSRALGEPQTYDHPLDLKPFLAAARAAVDDSQGEEGPRSQALLSAAQAMQDQPIATQRERFVALGEAAVAFFKRSPPDAKAVPKLYVFNCPMAFGEKGALWLQDNDAIANPFYPTQMKRCGSLVEQIAGK